MDFVKAWSQFYQHKASSIYPSFAKFSLPASKIEPKSDHTLDVAPLSSMVADFDAAVFEHREKCVRAQTVRLDLDFPGKFVDQICALVKEEGGLHRTRVSRGDAFCGYLLASLQEALDKPLEALHQFVTVSLAIRFLFSTE